MSLDAFHQAPGTDEHNPPNMVHLIGLSGRRGSGKDTVARLIQQLQPERNWQIRSFGDSIKSVCAALTGEDVAPYYSQKGKAELVPTFHRTRGEMLQQVGRPCAPGSRWCGSMPSLPACRHDAFVLVPDVRFANEADPIRARGGLMLRVEGDPLQQRGDGTRDDNHPSETAMDDYPHFAATLHNTGSRDDLTRQVRELLSGCSSILRSISQYCLKCRSIETRRNTAGKFTPLPLPYSHLKHYPLWPTAFSTSPSRLTNP